MSQPNAAVPTPRTPDTRPPTAASPVTSGRDESGRDESGRDEPGGTHQRRRRWPALVLLLVLAVAGILVWSQVLAAPAQVAEVVSCPRPGAPEPTTAENPEQESSPLGESVLPEVLDDTAPAAPRDTPVRVTNANGQRGQAGLVSAQLVAELGFPASGPGSVNDPIYLQQNMDCVGQIRFGADGVAQARTLHLAVPCAELIRDERGGAAVDLALGTRFDDLAPGADATTVLSTLEDSTPEAPTEVDPLLLDAAGDVRC